MTLTFPDLERVVSGHYKGSYRGADFDLKKDGDEWRVHHGAEIERGCKSMNEALRHFVYMLDVEAVDLPPYFEDFLRDQSERVKAIALRLDPSDIQAMAELTGLRSKLGSLENMFRSNVLEFTKRLQKLERRQL